MSDRLHDQLEKLLARKTEIDAAINGLTHAIHCPEPLPYECPRFKQELATTFTAN